MAGRLASAGAAAEGGGTDGTDGGAGPAEGEGDEEDEEDFGGGGVARPVPGTSNRNGAKSRWDGFGAFPGAARHCNALHCAAVLYAIQVLKPKRSLSVLPADPGLTNTRPTNTLQC